MKAHAYFLFLSWLLLSWQCVKCEVELLWQHFELGKDIGTRGVVVGDFDGNGFQETFVVANQNKDLVSIQYNGYDYNTDKVLKRPVDNAGRDAEIHSLAHLKTNAD